MKYVRGLLDGSVIHGILQGEAAVCLLEGDPFAHPSGVQAGLQAATGALAPLDKVTLLAPVSPSKILCAGLNYIDHIRETHSETPASPVIFMKPPTCVIGPGESVVHPAISRHVDYEGELAVVIARKARRVAREDALSFVAGLCCANDVSARDYQPPTGQWTIGKGFDTFLPLGPVMETDAMPDQLDIRTYVNGALKQSSNTRNLLFDVKYLIEYLSRAMTLMPGDIILTGTPSGVGPVAPGDVVEVFIEGIGRLVNPVVSEEK